MIIKKKILYLIILNVIFLKLKKFKNKNKKKTKNKKNKKTKKQKQKNKKTKTYSIKLKITKNKNKMPRKIEEINEEIDDKAVRISKQKTLETWDSFRRFGQPLIVISCVGPLLIELHKKCLPLDHGDVIEPAIAFPLAAIAIASCVNFAEIDISQVIRNYIFYILKGLVLAAAVVGSIPSRFIFETLNEGWLRDIFTGTLLHEKNGTGFRTLVLFHTFNLFLNSYIVKFAYGV